MRGFRASRAVRNFTSAKFGRNESYSSQPSFQSNQHNNNSTHKPQSLPAWLQLANTDVYTSTEKPKSETPVVSAPKATKLTLVSNNPNPVKAKTGKKTVKAKKKLSIVKTKAAVKAKAKTKKKKAA